MLGGGKEACTGRELGGGGVDVKGTVYVLRHDQMCYFPRILLFCTYMASYDGERERCVVAGRILL